MSIKYTDVISSFQPAKEISDPRRFSGRREQLISGTQLLLAGDHIFIYGSRGIGKSSLAKQLEVIANGNQQILQEINSPLYDEDFDFATCFITRDESINNLNQLLYRLTIDSNCFGKFQYLHELFGAPPSNKEGAKLDPDRVSDFWRRATTIAKHHTNGLAIFVDEFELIKNHDGFSSFIKAAQAKVIFIITGIANTEKELVRDHQSIERQLNTGKLPLSEMTELELRAVVSKAENSINSEIKFTEDAKNELVSVVKGQPYLLHLIGRQSFLTAFGKKQQEISTEDIKSTLEYVAKNKIDSGLEERYQNSIGHSLQQEIVLRLFAKFSTPNSHTSNVYPLAKDDGVTNPSNYVAKLQLPQYGSELIKVAEQTYAFKDRLFQAYASATPTRLTKLDIEKTAHEKNIESIEFSSELIHFSDIHFGEDHFFTQLPSAHDNIPSEDKPSFEKYVLRAIEDENLKPNAILISGDFVKKGLTSEFNIAKNSLLKIRDTFNSINQNSTKFITCPGNHDVNWDLIKADEDAKNLAFLSYINFRNAISNDPQIGTNTTAERLYEISKVEGSVKILVVSFNSAVLEGPSEHRGYIGDIQMNNAISEAKSHPEWNDSIRIAMFHHHLTPVSSIESKISAELLLTDSAQFKNKLLNENFSIAIHGHRHHAHSELVSNGNNSLIVIGGGSGGVVRAERGEQQLHFNKITISNEKNVKKVRITAYVFNSNDYKWETSLSIPPKIFPL